VATEVVDIFFDSVADFGPIEAAMLVEAGILGSDDGVLEVGRDTVDGDEGVAPVVGFAGQLCLEEALDLQGGGRGCHPAERDERQRGGEPDAEDEGDAPAEETGGQAAAARGSGGNGPGGSHNPGYSTSGYVFRSVADIAG